MTISQKVSCPLVNCEHERLLREKTAEYKDLDKQFLELSKEQEKQEKIIAEVIKEKPALKEDMGYVVKYNETYHRLRVTELEKEKMDKTVKRMEEDLRSKEEILEKQRKEVLEIKNEYQLDEEMLEKEKKIDVLRKELLKLNFERNRLTSLSERIKQAQEKERQDILKLRTEYNTLLKSYKEKRSKTPLVKKIKFKKVWLMYFASATLVVLAVVLYFVTK